MDFELKGRHAIVTGGSRGSGRATVLALSQQGAMVSTCYVRDSDEVGTLAEELEQMGADKLISRCAVTDQAQVDRLGEQAHRRFGPVDRRVIIAGVISLLPLERRGPEEWLRVRDTNLSGM